MLNRLQYLIYRCKYRYAPYLPLTKPVDVSLELSSVCNCKCSYCYHASSKPPFVKQNMDLFIAMSILTQVAELGVHSLKFNWRGESTLHPDFEFITDTAKKLANGSTFIDRISNTNMKFNPKKENIIRGLCNQTKVKISLDSLRKDVLEKQRIGAKYDYIMQNIDNLYNAKGRDNIIVIQAVRTQLNKDEDLYSDVKKRWPEAEVSIRDMVSGRIEGAEEMEVKSRDFSQRQPCLQAFNRLIFSSEGNAMTCCPDVAELINLGNIQDNTISELFNSKKVNRIRRKLKNKTAFTMEPCKSCSSFESFTGFEAGWHS